MEGDTWQRSRLIPTSGIGGQEEKERRATSAFLAVLGAVKEFGRAVLQPLGAPAGTIDTYCEVTFAMDDGRKLRTDGVVTARRGNKTWTLLVEVKTGAVELTQQQVESYLEIVRDRKFDGLLTISNQIVHTVNQHPIRVDGKRFGRMPLYHLSWVRILTIAQMVKEHQGVSDPDQAWILGELIRYLEFEGSGAVMFDDMGAHWPTIREAVRHQTLRAADEGVRETTVRWDQLIQYICLRLASRLGREVRPLLTRREIENPESRINAIVHDLTQDGTLSAAVRIPDTIGPLQIRANIRTMMAEVSVDVEAPDLKRPAARVNWLVRQLRNAPAGTRIDAAFLWARETTSELLSAVSEDPKKLLAGNSRPPSSFRLATSKALGTKRKSGKGSFITDLSSLVDNFYRDVVQDLKPWSQPAPQLPPEEGVPAGSAAVLEGTERLEAELSPRSP
ncbi:MAG: hypothetical protein WEB04_08020 [Dehalococcoidia bacterium]